MGRSQLLFLLLHSLILIVSCHDPIKSSQLTRRTLLEEQPQQSSEHLQKVLQRYLNNEEQEAHLRDFVARCGDIATLTSAGKSVEGRELWVLEISDRPGQQEAEPNVKYVGNVHGDEPTGRMLSLALAEWLCANHKTHGQAKRIVNDLHLFIMPSMNPDGFSLKTRENKERKDLNRNFPDRYGSRGMRSTGREQPETLAIMDWTLKTGFVASASFHEGAVLANYPWDGTPKRTTEYWACPDDATYRHLAKTYASAHRTMAQSKEFKDGITNGAAWYPIYGSMQDWNYVAAGCLELTLELSDNKWPPEPGLAALWEDNRPALLAFPLTAALGGLRGSVKGQAAKLRAGKGQELTPVVANVSVVGIDFTVRSRERFGDFYRPLAPGQYGILVTCEGYVPFSANVTIPGDGSGTVLDVILQPAGGTSGGDSGDEKSAEGREVESKEGVGGSGGSLSSSGGDGGNGSAGGGHGGATAQVAVGKGDGGSVAAGRGPGPATWAGLAAGGGGESRAKVWRLGGQVQRKMWDQGASALWGTKGMLLAFGGALMLQGLWVARHRLRWRLRQGGRMRGE